MKCDLCDNEARWRFLNKSIDNREEEKCYCDNCKENMILEQIADLFVEFELIEEGKK